MIGVLDQSTINSILGGAGNPAGSLAAPTASGGMLFTGASSGALLSATGGAQGGVAAPLKTLPMQISTARTQLADLNKQIADAKAAAAAATTASGPTQASATSSSASLLPKVLLIAGIGVVALLVTHHGKKKGKV